MKLGWKVVLVCFRMSMFCLPVFFSLITKRLLAQNMHKMVPWCTFQRLFWLESGWKTDSARILDAYWTVSLVLCNLTGHPFQVNKGGKPTVVRVVSPKYKAWSRRVHRPKMGYLEFDQQQLGFIHEKNPTNNRTCISKYSSSTIRIQKGHSSKDTGWCFRAESWHQVGTCWRFQPLWLGIIVPFVIYRLKTSFSPSTLPCC